MIFSPSTTGSNISSKTGTNMLQHAISPRPAPISAVSYSPRLVFCECACSATSKFCGLLLPNVGSATSISLPWRSCCSAVVGHRVHVVGTPASAQALPDADRQLQSVCELLPPWLLPVAPPRSPCPGGAFALQLWAIGCMWWAHQPDMRLFSGCW